MKIEFWCDAHQCKVAILEGSVYSTDHNEHLIDLDESVLDHLMIDEGNLYCNFKNADRQEHRFALKIGSTLIQRVEHYKPANT